jgi:sulfofructose kinase
MTDAVPGAGARERSGARARLLCVGLATVDVVAQARGELVAGVKQFADRITTTYGGPATTAAVAAAQLGVDVELVVALGDDERGAQLRAALASRAIGTELVVVRDGVGTATSLVVVTPDGERTIINATDPLLRDALAPPAAAAMMARAAEVDAVLVDVRWPAAAALALAAAAQAAVPGVLDLDRTDAGEQDRVRGLARAASHVIASQDALDDLLAGTGSGAARAAADDPEAALDALASLAGGGMVAVTLGSRGVAWRDVDGSSGLDAPPDVTAVETLGAGDVWHGAFAAALARRVPVGRAVVHANAAAALRVSRSGGWDALADLAEVDELLAHAATSRGPNGQHGAHDPNDRNDPDDAQDG